MFRGLTAARRCPPVWRQKQKKQQQALLASHGYKRDPPIAVAFLDAGTLRLRTEEHQRIWDSVVQSQPFSIYNNCHPDDVYELCANARIIVTNKVGHCSELD